MLPPRGGEHHLQVQMYEGLDAVLLPLLPRALRLRVVAWKILRHHNYPQNISPGSFTFSLPGESLVYEIANARSYPAFRLLRDAAAQFERAVADVRPYFPPD